jgi:hypothetical protein
MRQMHETFTAPDFLSQLVRETARARKLSSVCPQAPSAKKPAQVGRETVLAIPSIATDAWHLQ